MRRVIQIARIARVRACAREITTSTSVASSSSSGRDDRTIRPMPESLRAPVEEHQPAPSEDEVARRRALALKEWLTSELGEERTTLMAILAKHHVQIAGGGDEARALMQELLEWKAQGVVDDAGTR